MSEPGALIYTAGTNVSLIAPGTALIFAQPPSGETVSRCWPLVRDHADAGVIVAALASAGSASLPGFALVRADADGASVIVRSPGHALTVDTRDVTRELAAEGLATWLETRLDASAVAVTIAVTPELPAPGVVPSAFPLVGGTVLAASVTMSLAGATPQREPAAAAESLVPTGEVARGSDPAAQSSPSGPAPEREPEPIAPLPLAAASITPVAPPMPASPMSMSVTVQAVACPYGHLGPTYETYCRLCGTAVEDPRPFLAERPPLGLLRLSTGDVVPLDRGVIMGRNPRAVDEQDSGRPHLVRLPSPDNDVSRTHVEVRLEDWHVLVVDLGSTNGTTVTIPGQAPIRLRAHEPMPIEPNAEVNLADEIVFRFEVPSA